MDICKATYGSLFMRVVAQVSLYQSNFFSEAEKHISHRDALITECSVCATE